MGLALIVVVSQTRSVPQSGLIQQVGPKYFEILQITVRKKGQPKDEMQHEKEEFWSIWLTFSNDVNIII